MTENSKKLALSVFYKNNKAILPFFLFRYDADLCGVQEFDDIADLFPVGHLVTDLQGSVEDTHLAVEDKTVSVGHVFADTLFDMPGFHHGVVGACILNRVAARNDIGGDILGEAGSRLEHGKGPTMRR